MKYNKDIFENGNRHLEMKSVTLHIYTQLF